MPSPDQGESTMSQTILVTGSCGLIGRTLSDSLRARGHAARGLDLIAVDLAERGDVTDGDCTRAVLAQVDGVVHLAAVSRVVTAERDPARCHVTNVDGTRNVLAAAAASPAKPWVIVASSREVYGQSATLPVREDAPRRPLNVYARSKCAAEDLALAACRDGVRVAIARFSNVYGSARDHRDRVVPAFVRAALAGAPLRVDGSDRLFDFTHVDDVARALIALIERLGAGADSFPPLHFASGIGTPLGELAALAVSLADSRSEVVEAPPRDYDVARFVGDPTRAARELGWRAEISLRDGLARLIADLRTEVSA